VQVQRDAQAHFEEAKGANQVDYQCGAQYGGIEEYKLLTNACLDIAS